jgi:hypothetical protein
MTWLRSARLHKLDFALSKNKYNRASSRRRKRRSAEQLLRRMQRIRKADLLLNALRSKLLVSANDSCSYSLKH